MISEQGLVKVEGGLHHFLIRGGAERGGAIPPILGNKENQNDWLLKFNTVEVSA